MDARKVVKILLEGSGKLVVVDVQPAHSKYFSTQYALRVANSMNDADSVLVLFNGPDLGYKDTAESLAEWYEEMGVDTSHCTFLEKGYGFAREWMGRVPDSEIVRVLAELIERGMGDSRDLPEELLPEGVDPGESIGLPAADVVDALKKFSGARFIGGGSQECLAEIILLARAAKVAHTLDRSLVY